jgi:hypothetical protein
MPEIKFSEWLIILSTLAGPVLAVQTQKLVERVSERRRGKLRLFYALMSTRAARLSPEHVQALNMIDLEFFGSRILSFRYQSRAERNVVAAWREYQVHLNQAVPESEGPMWNERGYEYFVSLLAVMAVALDFDFDRAQLKTGYSPVAHGEQDALDRKTRVGLAAVLSGEAPLKVAVNHVETSPFPDKVR